MNRRGRLLRRSLFVRAIRVLSPYVALVGLVSLMGDSPAFGAQQGEGSKAESFLGLSEGLGEEMTIESESLEIRRLAGDRRLLVFEKGVFVQQADLSLYADALRAFYGPDDSEPERLEARGDVRVVLRDQRAWCEEADFDRSLDQIICRIGARLERGCDRVWGESIVLDLTEERARVLGGAKVQIRDGGEEGAGCLPNSGPSGGGR
ncbi:MAG: hypothetical protein CBC48_02625 [bacterium TMED88]|nr:hypothetical protein [Deltaproteobacteria bacterium]OUV36178.1 MAG: hypothetical protein CBC48_02625 [bacterium TMED88]